MSAYTSLKKVYVFLFARKAFFPLNRLMYKLSVHGMGVLNYENDRVSGEAAFIRFLIKKNKLASGVIFDVGANVGNYSVMLIEKGATAPVYAFEPHPATFAILQKSAEKNKFHAVEMGLSASPMKAKIYDSAESDGSEHASIFRNVIEKIHEYTVKETDIELTSIDVFVKDNNISNISFLKIDTEGNELNVLKGATGCIANNMIDIIQIEFNEMNIMSRTFLSDIINVLPGFEFYRLLPDSMYPLGKYRPLFHEIFAFQNIVAVRKGIL
ncbi:FkbM family methyltransferase [Ferruginibacter sp. SUN106]|uniref:FkbM family methyltransferase n=1 Tax=Ferruginibacter sp. SUN106 TaxID=2978348 RepID=UPI003D364CDB